MKILNTIFKRDSDEMKIPHSVQGILPVQTIWQDGIFLVGKNKYSKRLYEISDLGIIRDSLKRKQNIKRTLKKALPAPIYSWVKRTYKRFKHREGKRR